MVCPLTSNLDRARFRSHVLLPAVSAGLDRDSVVLASQIMTVDRTRLGTLTGRLPDVEIGRVLASVALSLGITAG